MSRYLPLRVISSRMANRRRVGSASVTTVLLLGAVSAVVTILGLPLSAASASAAPQIQAPHTSTFCGFAANVSKSDSTPSTVTPASLQATYTKLKSEEAFILANTPSQLKGDFTTVFTWLNKFISILSSVKYNFAKLTPTQLKAFTASDTKQVQTASNAISAYVKNVCHVKL